METDKDNPKGIARRNALKRVGLLVAGAAALGMPTALTSCNEEKKKRIILYFTATGNSLYIARQLANEHTELLTNVREALRLLRLMTNHVESHSLGQRSRHQNNQQHKPALTNSHDISFLHVKTRRAVSGNVAMSLLITTVHYYFKSPTVCTSSHNAGSHDER